MGAGTTRRGLRALVALVVVVLAAAGATTASAAEPPAGSATITTGHLDWGFRTSFRNYVSGSGDPVPIAASGGATINPDGTFRFPVTGGFHHTETGTTVVHLGGQVVFSYSAHHFRITVANPTVEIGFSSQRLRADVTTEVTNPQYGTSSEVVQGEVGTLDITGITPTVADGVTTWAAVPGAMTAAGAESFAGFLWPGAELDPATLTYTGPGGVPTADLPDPDAEEPEETWTDPGTVTLAAEPAVADLPGATSVLWHPGTDRLLVRDATSVRAFDVATMAPAGAVTGLPALTGGGFFTGPGGVVYSVNGSGSTEKTITAIDPRTMTVTGTATVAAADLPQQSYFTTVVPDATTGTVLAYVENAVVEIDAATGAVLRTSAVLDGSSNAIVVDPDGTVYAWRFVFSPSMATAVHALERTEGGFTAAGRTEIAGQVLPRLLDHRNGRIWAVANLAGLKTIVFEARDADGVVVDQLGAPFATQGFAGPAAYDPANQDVWHSDLSTGAAILVDMTSRQVVASYSAQRLGSSFAITDESRVFVPTATGIVELVRSVSPSITADPSPVEVELGHRETGRSVTVTAAAAGTPAPTVQWQSAAPAGPWGPSPWVDIPGATGTSLTFTATTADSGRRLRAVFTNEVGTYGTRSATVTVTTATPPPADERWLAQVATDLLGAPLDPAGTAWWRDRLEAGQSREGVARALAGSQAARRAQVSRLYQQYLRRPAEPAGAAYWAARYDAATLPGQLRRQLLASAEYRTRAGGTETAFVDAVYLDVLRRPADAAGRAYWVDRVGTTADRAALIGTFLRTTEARGALVDDHHRIYLRRPATGAERARGATALVTRGAELTLVAGLLATYEYADLT
ncbi:MAG TPA: HtaA domain-containing protein [Iamia sp.]|nr:HtaA domain-containing protein [Iamia sp.]